MEHSLPLLWSLSRGVYAGTHLLNRAFMLHWSIECTGCLKALQLFLPSGSNRRQLLGFNTHFAWERVSIWKGEVDDLWGMCSTESSNNRVELVASAGAFVTEGGERAEQRGVVPADRNYVAWCVCFRGLLQQMWVSLQWLCWSCCAVSRNSQNTDLCKCQTFLLNVYNGHASRWNCCPWCAECCSQEGWSCVNVLSVIDQFNLLMKVYWG